MGRRSRSGLADDVMALVARLPWWAGVALAVASYALLHNFAMQPVAPVSLQAGQLGQALTQALWRTLAGIGQYLLPVLCLAGAALSAWRRRVRAKLLDGVAQSDARNALDGMRWREFEMLVGEAFRQQGYRVTETGGGGPDDGIDLVLTQPVAQGSGSKKFLVQCKQWRTMKVGVGVVRELFGVMAAKGADGGFVVTSGRFTDAAKEFARGRSLHLIEGPELRALIRGAQSHQAAAQQTAPRNAVRPHSPPPAIWPTEMPTPTTMERTATVPRGNDEQRTPPCPRCDQPMLMRTARQGHTAGVAFWGCSRYPACRGNRPLA